VWLMKTEENKYEPLSDCDDDDDDDDDDRLG
jgi:hypothetical protein